MSDEIHRELRDSLAKEKRGIVLKPEEVIGLDDPYQVRIGGELADPYRIAHAYDLDGIQTQALKKLLRKGRKHKSEAEDMREVITTLERWEELNS